MRRVSDRTLLLADSLGVGVIGLEDRGLKVGSGFCLTKFSDNGVLHGIKVKSIISKRTGVPRRVFAVVEMTPRCTGIPPRVMGNAGLHLLIFQLYLSSVL